MWQKIPDQLATYAKADIRLTQLPWAKLAALWDDPPAIYRYKQSVVIDRRCFLNMVYDEAAASLSPLASTMQQNGLDGNAWAG